MKTNPKDAVDAPQMKIEGKHKGSFDVLALNKKNHALGFVPFFNVLS